MTPADRVQSLAALLEGTSVGLLELAGPDGVFRLRRGAPSHGAAAPMTDRADDSVCVVRAPSVGTFRGRHPLQDAPLTQAGDQVEAGDVVGLIQVGTLFLHVLAPVTGVVSTMVAADGEMIGFGAPLLRLAEEPA